MRFVLSCRGVHGHSAGERLTGAVVSLLCGLERRKSLLKWKLRVLPGGPVVKTLLSDVGAAGSIPGEGITIPDASWPKTQNVKQKQYCNKIQ